MKKLSRVELLEDKDAMQKAVRKALQEYKKFSKDCKRNDIIAVFNIDEPSYRRRLYIVDVRAETPKVIRTHHCTHGEKSSDPNDRAYAIYFSNKNGSHKSSIGAMKTSNTYRGKYGRSLRLEGLEKTKNGNVRSRYIVIHPAHYATDRYILANGRAGQSWGCPAVDENIAGELIKLLKNGVFFYVFHEKSK